MIIFKPLTKLDESFLYEVNPRPENAKDFRVSSKVWLFQLPFIILCLVLLFVKRNMINKFPMVPYLIPFGIITGMPGCYVHELMHALALKNKGKIYIGLILKKFIFYMKSKEPMTRSEFIKMSLAPVVLGIIPLFIFMVSHNIYLNSMMWPMAMIGLVSPGPDYQNVYYALKQVPEDGYIQDDKEGLCFYTKGD